MSRNRYSLLIVSILMPLTYWLGIVYPFPLSYGIANPGFTWIAANQGSYLTIAWQISLYLLVTLLHVSALHFFTKKQEHSQVWLVWAVWLLCSFILLFASPNGESHDLYDYIFRGRMQDHYAASPLQVTPNAYAQAPFYEYVSWKHHVDTYGPLWEYTSALTAKSIRIVLQNIGRYQEELPSCPHSQASCPMLAGYVIGYRLLAILLTGLSGLLIAAIIGTSKPDAVPSALAFWLWNPLLLISTALGAHNDALMLLWIFACFWLWQQQRWFAGWLAFALAAQVKLTALLLVPVLGLWLVRKIGWLRALGISFLAALLALGLSWLLYLPLGGWATLPRMLYERQLFVAHSFAQILYFWLYKLSGWDWSLVWTMMVKWSTWLFLPVAALLLLRSFGKVADCKLQVARNHLPLATLFRTCTLLTLLYLLVGSFWLQPWYFVWVLALAALWVDGAFPRYGLPWSSFGALSSNIIYTHLTQMPIAADPNAHAYRVWVTMLVVSMIWLPLLIAQAVAQWAAPRHCNVLD